MNRFNFLLVFLVFASYCFGYQSLNVPPNTSLKMTVPSVAPFTSMGDYRISFRLHDWTPPASGTVALIKWANAAITLDASGNLCGVDSTDTMTSGNLACVSVKGLNDVVARMQRFGSSFPVRNTGTFQYPGSTWFEAVDLTSGNSLPYTCANSHGACPMKAPLTPDISGTTGYVGTSIGFSLAWLKWFSSTVPPGSPLENEATPAEFADWRFEGNITNQGTGGYAVSLKAATGTPAYSASPVKPPACNLTRQIFRAGTAAQLVNYAYPLDSTGTLSYSWQQLSGPTQLTWTGQTTSQPTVAGGVFGSYTLQLAVIDGSGQTSTCSIKDGFVATDANGVVVSANPQVDLLLGPQIQLGKNPWGWFDDRQVAEAAVQATNLPPYFATVSQPWNVAAPGTIGVTRGSAIVTGDGTTFTTTFCQGATGNPSRPKSPTPYISIWYPWAPFPAGTGRRPLSVASCQSDTQLTLSAVWNNTGFLPSGSGWNYAFIDGNLFNTWIFTTSPSNFYDVATAFYSLYYRSGIDDYLNAARMLADTFWQFRMDSGNCYHYGDGSCWTFPRNQSLTGMLLRALDGRPDMWPGIETVASNAISTYHAQFQAYGNWTSIGGDPRENGYLLMEESYCALLDPNATAAAACRAGIKEIMTRGWQPGQFPDGYWYSLYWGGMGGAGNQYASWTSGTSISLTNGSPIGTCVNGSGTCNWTHDMFTTGSTGTYAQVWWFINSPTSAPKSNADGDPIAYYPVFVDSSHMMLQDINGNPLNYQGTTGVHGYAVGNSTLEVGFTVQPYMYGILGAAFDYAGKAMACTSPGVPANCDDGIAKMAHTFNVQTANYTRLYGYWPLKKGMYYSAGNINCTPPVADNNIGCTSGNTTASQSRTLNAETLRGVMTAYAYNSDPDLLAFADTLYTAMWARPGFQAPGAPAGDGSYVADYEDWYGSYMIGVPPGGVQHKYFGMGFGIGAGSAWPGYRLGGAHIGSIVNSPIVVNLASVPQAVAFNALVTYATGATATIQCGASPCTVSFDQSVGSPVVQIQYLSASGAVLATQPYTSASLLGINSLALSPAKVLAITVPSASPFTALADTRLEFRLHNWTTPATNSTILALGGPPGAPLFSVELTAGNELCGLDWADSLPVNGNRMCADITNIPDVVVRMQRDTINNRFNYEVRTVENTPLVTYCGSKPSGLANQFGCPIQTVNLVSWAGVGEIGDAASVATLEFAWIKWYSTVVPAGSGSIQELAPADLADWRFDGNTNEVATGVVATIQGVGTYAPKPVYPPVCVAGAPQTFRAGHQAQLDGSASYPLDGGTTLTYSWREVAGPTQAGWIGANSATPTITRLIAGSYTFELTVTDNSRQSSTCTVKDGSVASDSNDVVVSNNSALDRLIGPQVRSGASPAFDQRYRAAADLQIKNLDLYYPPYWDTPAQGTVMVTPNSAMVTGSGTTFTTTFCQGPQNPNAVKPSAAGIDIWYPAGSGQTGRRELPVLSCQSDTQLTLASPWTPDLAGGANLSYSYADQSMVSDWAYNANFYDSVAAFYILYYRSGADDYLIAARKLADRLWLSPWIDRGTPCGEPSTSCKTPRNISQLGLVLRALDQRPDMWPGLRSMWTRQIDSVNHFAQYQAVVDPTEQGFELAMLSYCALADPDAGSQANCKAAISQSFQNVWTPFQGKDSSWPTLWYGGDGGAPGYSSWDTHSSAILANGSTVVLGNGTSWTADLFPAYGTATVWFTNRSARPADNSAGDPVLYTATWVDGTHLKLDQPYAGTTGIHGWALAGNGQPLGWGVEPSALGILATSFDLSAKAIEDVDPVTAALAHRYNVAAVNWLKNRGYRSSTKGLYSHAGQLDCQPPISDSNDICTGGNDAGQGRTLNSMVLRAAGAAYAFSGDSSLKEFGDLLFSAMYATPGDSAPVAGPSIARSVPRQFGMFFGFGDNSSWPAYRAGGSEPPRTRLVSISTQHPSGAVKMRVTITEPNGASRQVECGFSQCGVTVDGRMGDPTVTVEYLSSSNSVLGSAPGTIVAQTPSQQ